MPRRRNPQRTALLDKADKLLAKCERDFRRVRAARSRLKTVTNSLVTTFRDLVRVMKQIDDLDAGGHAVTN